MAHLFREQVGQSPHALMDRQRIQLAKRYLRNSTSNITEIAESCGYGSVYSFSKRFKKITGVSPAQYRLIDSATLFP
jgi:AraC-like DNA-binding protein